MFNENQKQSVGEQGFAIQVNGDLTIHQNDAAQLRTIFEELFKEGFPRQSAVAYEAGRSNVQELAVAVVDESQRANYPVSIERLGNPDVHASLYDAINLTGRRGQAANPKLLAQLLVMRMYDQPTPLLDVVMSEAIQVVPKLTKPQLAFLVLLHARNGTIPDPLTYERLETLGRAAAPFMQDAKDLAAVNLAHLQYSGALAMSVGPTGMLILSDDAGVLGELFKSFLGRLPLSNVDEFTQTLKELAPTYYMLAAQWQVQKGMDSVLTSVGRLIALTLMMPALGYRPEELEQLLS